MERKQAIYILENGLNIDGSWSKALNMAINSLKTDEAYQLMFEKVDFYTKDEVISMFTDIQEQLVKQYYINRHELHNDFANIGIEQASNIVEEKIYALKEQADENDD